VLRELLIAEERLDLTRESVLKHLDMGEQRFFHACIDLVNGQIINVETLIEIPLQCALRRCFNFKMSETQEAQTTTISDPKCPGLGPVRRLATLSMKSPGGAGNETKGN